MIGYTKLNADDHPTGTRFIGRKYTYVRTMREMTVVEWSPSKKRVKLRNTNGSTFWVFDMPIVDEVLLSQQRTDV